MGKPWVTPNAQGDPQVSPRWPKVTPKMAKGDPKVAKVCPKVAQGDPKMAQGGPKMTLWGTLGESLGRSPGQDTYGNLNFLRYIVLLR